MVAPDEMLAMEQRLTRLVSKPSTTASSAGCLLCCKRYTVASQGTASGGGTASVSQALPQSAQPPDLATVQAHIMAALETDLLDKIMALVEQWPQYYGSLTRALVEELVPKGLCLNPAGEYLACAFCRAAQGTRLGCRPEEPLPTTVGIQQKLAPRPPGCL